MVQSNSDDVARLQPGSSPHNPPMQADEDNTTSGQQKAYRVSLAFDEHEAVEIGLNEAIILSQFRYWHKVFRNQGQPDRWIYNTYQDWQTQFPFMSDRTVRRGRD